LNRANQLVQQLMDEVGTLKQSQSGSIDAQLAKLTQRYPTLPTLLPVVAFKGVLKVADSGAS
jgi:hypothetical protein